MLEQAIKDLTAATVTNSALLEQLLGQKGTEKHVTEQAIREASNARKATPKKAAETQTKDAEVPTVDDVRDALIRLADGKGRSEAKEILGAYDVTKLGDLPEDKFASVIHAATQCLAA